MRVKRTGVQSSARDRLDGLAHALHIDLRVALMSVDDIDPAPVPKPHVNRVRPVLMIAGNDQLAALGGDFSRKIKRPLLAYRFDHPFAEKSSGQLLDAFNNRLMVGHRDRLGSAIFPCDVKAVVAPRNGNHPCARVGRKTSEKRPREANTNDGDRLPRLDVSLSEDVEGAAERLAWEGLSGKPVGKFHQLVGIGHIMGRVAVVAERGDAVPDRKAGNPFANRLDHALSFMPHSARLSWIGEPFRAAP